MVSKYAFAFVMFGIALGVAVVNPRPEVPPPAPPERFEPPEVNSELLERPARLTVEVPTPVVSIIHRYRLSGATALCRQARCASCPECVLKPGKVYHLYTAMLGDDTQ